MIATPHLRWLLSLVLFVCPVSAFGQPVDLDENSPYVWDLTDLYPSAEEWEAERGEIEARIPILASFEGRLHEGPDVMEEALNAYFDLLRSYYRFAVYASLKSDEDTRNAHNLEQRQIVEHVGTSFSQATSYLSPEIVSLGADKVESYIAEHPGLADYDFFLRDIVREAPHVLTPEAERVMAMASMAIRGATSIYNVISNADLPWPTIFTSETDSVTLSPAGYTLLRSSPDRALRKEVFDRYWETWRSFESTFGAIMVADVRSTVFQAQAREYDSALHLALSGTNVPADVYRTLIDETNTHLPTLHRYFRLRGRMLDVDTLRYYDIYPPLVAADVSFSLEDAKELTVAALEPFGPAYLDILREGFSQRWMHVYPQSGKRSGAYMAGAAYDVHPYVLLNFNSDFESVSTFAHEWGHAVHSVLAGESQPFSKARYSTFTAEVASMINEILLKDFMIENAESDEERLFYLGQVLESIRGGFFRQAMFAEFELAIHEEIEAGGALSGERLTQMYGELLRRYHGHDEGVLLIDDEYAIEWAAILHFFNYNFYVYQYATSIAGGTYFARRIMDGGEEERETFLDVLRAGGSDHAYNILTRAGVDLATPEPYQALADLMNEIMDEIESILDARN